MAATLTTRFAGTAATRWESRRSPRKSELWEIVGGSGGSADGDTGSIVPSMKMPQLVIGAVSYTISGQTVTVTAITALAENEVIAVEVVGRQ